MWKDDAAAKEGMTRGLKYADILKISEVELTFLTGYKDLDRGSRVLFDMGVKIVIVTLAPKGCYFKYVGGTGYMNTYDTKVTDTTGAGDAFLGGFLFHIGRLDCKLEDLSRHKIEQMMDYANATDAICASKKVQFLQCLQPMRWKIV